MAARTRPRGVRTAGGQEWQRTFKRCARPSFSVLRALRVAVCSPLRARAAAAMRALGASAACGAASCATSARAARRAPPRVALRRAQLGCSRARRTPLTLAADAERTSVSVADGTPPARAAFASTPSLVKGLVSALTAAVNAAAGASAQPAAAPAVDVHAAPLSPAALHDGVRADFGERCYLWTGDISAELYDADCSFTDPTLSFKYVIDTVLLAVTHSALDADARSLPQRLGGVPAQPGGAAARAARRAADAGG